MMLNSLIALSLLQAPASAAAPPPAQDVAMPQPRQLQGWTVADDGRQGCLLHTSQRGGTVLSMIALPDQAGVGFLLQNPKWTTLEDGSHYDISIRFDDGQEWPVPALARTDIDADGPGLYFQVDPGAEEGGQEFIAQFAAANAMTIATGGRAVERMQLTNSRGATVMLAQCLSRMWEAGSNPFSTSDGAGTARRI